MPNGHDKNWVRLCAAINGFRGHYRRWPTRIRMSPLSLKDLRNHLFSKHDFCRIEAKVKLVSDEGAGMIAEDGSGASYSYGDEGFPNSVPAPSAIDWLKVKPKPSKVDEFTFSVRGSRKKGN